MADRQSSYSSAAAEPLLWNHEDQQSVTEGLRMQHKHVKRLSYQGNSPHSRPRSNGQKSSQSCSPRLTGQRTKRAEDGDGAKSQMKAPESPAIRPCTARPLRCRSTDCPGSRTSLGSHCAFHAWAVANLELLSRDTSVPEHSLDQQYLVSISRPDWGHDDLETMIDSYFA